MKTKVHSSFFFLLILLVSCNRKCKDKAEPFNVGTRFIPCGYFGDGEQCEPCIVMNLEWKDNPHSGSTCIKVDYTPGEQNFGGVFWLNASCNWGDQLGKNFADSCYTKLTFWARGDQGDEMVEFSVGGVSDKQYKDSFQKSLGMVTLTAEWKQYTIPLYAENFSSVIGGFVWSAANSRKTFYLDDIFFE